MRYYISFLPNLLLTLFMVFWMLFGGALFWMGWIPAYFLLSLVVLVVWALLALRGGRQPVLLGPALLFSLAVILSLAANMDILIEAAGVILIALFGLAALIVGADLGEQRLFSALYRSVWIWLPAWLLIKALGWEDNRNLAGVWPVVAILVILESGKPKWWALPHAAVLLVLGSRGAILGLSLGLLAWARPRLNMRQASLLLLVGLAFVWALTIYRPKEAFNRFAYWDQSLQALLGHNVWLGLGPGGLYARRIILEPGAPSGILSSYHGHAHNLLVQVLAELGLVGLLALAVSGAWVRQSGLRWSWPWPILIALLVHSLVDLPLYFPGPLLVFMLLAGSLVKGSNPPIPP